MKLKILNLNELFMNVLLDYLYHWSSIKPNIINVNGRIMDSSNQEKEMKELYLTIE